MESVAALRSSFGCFSPNLSSFPDLSPSGTKSTVSLPWVKERPSSFRVQLGHRKMGIVSRKSTRIRASVSDSGSSAGPIAPLEMESPIGQFLSQILVSHPHLVPAAVEQQLEQLQTDRDAENEKEDPSGSGTELVLYRRIAEVKENERKKALEEILYSLVVQKFMESNVPLIPSITPSSPDNLVDTSPSHEEKLKLLHSPDAYEMIQNHLTLILGSRLSNPNTIAEISKLRVGQVYAASVMYGYFLKRIDQRFQLEKRIKILPHGQIDNEDSDFQQVIGEDGDEAVWSSQAGPETSSWPGGVGFGGIKPSRLRSYVMSFDGDTLQKYATIRSKEAVGIVEKHTEALFGRPQIAITPEGTIDSSKDEAIKISFDSLKRVILEAVTFGSFLWDVESYVDSRYHFVAN